MTLKIIPLELSEANEMVRKYHRHHKPTQGHRFSIGVYDDTQKKLVGAVICGRPVARLVNHREVIEVVRLVTDGTKNACSILYSAAARVAREMGYRKIQTYILDTENGTSLLASGWTMEAINIGGGNGWQSRPNRRTDQPIDPKQRWSKVLRTDESILMNELLPMFVGEIK